MPSLSPTSEGWTGEDTDVATSSLAVSYKNDNDGDNNGSDKNEAMVCLTPLTKPKGEGGGIGNPIVFITLVGPLNESGLDRGSRDKGNKERRPRSLPPDL